MSARIIELQTEHVKRIRAVRITPKDGTVVISGKNDQGKSSVLDSIDFAFRGEKSICPEPLRTGEKNGVVRITLSEELNNICVIERKFTPSGTTLTIRNKEGVAQKSPQALLDAVIVRTTFDPLSFTRMKPVEQMEMLRKLVNLDFTELNKNRKATFDERTARGRELESAKARLAGYAFDPNLPAEPIPVTALAEQLGAVQAKNAGIRQQKQAVDAQAQKVHDLAEDARSLKGKIETLEKMLADTRTQRDAKIAAHAEAQIEAERMAKAIADLQSADETAIRAQIDNIQTTNSDIQANKLHVTARAEVELIEGAIKGLTAKIEEYDADKAAQIEFAQFPMPGLSFDEERGVLLNGHPFTQGSQARQLQAAVAIGLALNPQIKVIIIRDGSLMDDDSMKLVSDMCATNNAQLWIEIVNSKDPSAIVIEDGEVK